MVKEQELSSDKDVVNVSYDVPRLVELGAVEELTGSV